jgi:hypothetical protein
MPYQLLHQEMIERLLIVDKGVIDSLCKGLPSENEFAFDRVVMNMMLQ